MVAVPVVIPLTTPLVLTVATLVLALLHTCPDVVEESVVLLPAQTVCVPVIAAGVLVTDVAKVLWQPVESVYDMVVRPPMTALLIPVAEPIVATAVLLLAHVPPAGVAEYVVVAPEHTEAEPLIAEGVVFTVTTLVAKQPL
jgi:hypothetical protein